MIRLRKLSTLVLAAALLVAGGYLLLHPPATDAAEKAQAAASASADSGIVSAGPLDFGPDGVLFLGDPEGAAVWALKIGKTDPATGEAVDAVEQLDAKIGALLGVGPRDVRVLDMLVEEASGTAYLSVMRGQGEARRPALVTVARDGVVALVDLDATPKTRLAIDNPPDEDTRWYRRGDQVMTVTDLEFIDGELFIAGLSNEEFASTLRRSPYPFDGPAQVTGLEIFHGAHGKYETHAPIFSFIPMELGGKKHLLAGYLCTPLVTFSLDEVKGKSQLRGKTIAELGWGNVPTDLVPYSYDGVDWVLVNNTRRGAMKIKAADIAAANQKPGITDEVGPRSGLVDHSAPLGAVAQLDLLDAEHVMILGRSLEDGSLYLVARSTQWI